MNMAKPLTEKSKPTSQKGVVTAKVINVGPYPLPFNQLTIAPDNVNESKKVVPTRLQSKKTNTKGTTIYASEVDPGTYAVTSIRSFHINGDYSYSRFVTTDAQMGTFDVKPGHVTDLGTLIYYPKPDGDRYRDVLMRLPSFQNNLGATLTNYFPYVKSHKEGMLTWHDDEQDEERNILYSSIVQNPVLFNKRVQGPNGDIHFLSKLGVILSLNNDGEFVMDAVDTNDSLVALDEHISGSKAVADELGRIFVQQPDEAWKTLDVDFPRHVHKLTFISASELEVIASSVSRLYVQRVNLNSLAKTTLNTFSHDDSWKNTAYRKVGKKKDRYSKGSKKKKKRITSVYLYKENDTSYISIRGLGLLVPFAFGGGSSITFPYDPESWIIKSPKVDKDIDMIMPAGNKKLGIEYAGFWSWSGKPTYYVLDGKESRKLNTLALGCTEGEITVNYSCTAGNKHLEDTEFSLSSIPIFMDDKVAYVLGTLNGYDKELKKTFGVESNKQVQVLKTVDGGIHWTPTGNLPPENFCTDFVPEVADKLLLYCNGATGDFYESVDGGETWNQVREQVNF